MDAALCAWRLCTHNDASIRAESIFLIPMSIGYVIGSWLTVFPLMLFFRRQIPDLAAAFITSVAFALLAALLAHNPTLDGSIGHTLIALVPWLVVPWFLGGWIAIAMWPIHSTAA